MKGLTDEGFYLEDPFEYLPPEKVGVEIRKKYGIEIFRKTAEEGVFCCFVRIRSSGKKYAIIDWERKRADYKDEGEYKEAIESILKKLCLI